MTEERTILSVSQLNRLARETIESALAQVWVEGEISNFVRPSSGHWYFTLKDEQSQVRCAMFAGRNRAIRFQPANGMQVIVRGKASLYEGRGEYQLIAENITQAGEGLLQQRFEALKLKLEGEGLFAAEHKKPLPQLALHLGVVTSPTGAAIRDILTVLKRRFPAIGVTLFPTAVQGAEAADQIVNAIALAHRLPEDAPPLDALIIGRGGGSLEDLWPFNEERVARAIYAAQIPTVSAVGHEIDFTISDFVADVRAPTPSAAAELLSPDQNDWLDMLTAYEQLFATSIERSVTQKHLALTALSKRLRHPGQKIQDQMQRLDTMETRLLGAQRNRIDLYRAQLATLTAHLGQHHPRGQIAQFKLDNQALKRRLLQATQQQLKQPRQHLSALSHQLNTLSPLNTLARGYAIVKDEHGRIVRSAEHIRPGSRISNYLAKEKLSCTVDAIEPSDLVEISDLAETKHEETR